MHGENSEVLPAGSVAIAVMNFPPIDASSGKVVELTWPLAFVVTGGAAKMNFSPSPLPEGSQVELE